MGAQSPFFTLKLRRFVALTANLENVRASTPPLNFVAKTHLFQRFFFEKDLENDATSKLLKRKPVSRPGYFFGSNRGDARDRSC